MWDEAQGGSMKDSSRGLMQVGKAANQLGSAALGQALLSITISPLFPSFPASRYHTNHLCQAAAHFSPFLPNRGCLLFFPRHRWQPAGSKAHLREAKGNSVRQCRLVAYIKTNKRVSRTTNLHHEGHRQTVARHCPVAVGHR